MPGRLQSIGSQRVGHDWATSLSSGRTIHPCHNWITSRIVTWFGEGNVGRRVLCYFQRKHYVTAYGLLRLFFQSVGGKTLCQVEAVPPFWNRVKIMKNRGRIFFFSELELIHDGHTVWVGNKTLYYKLLKFWVWVHNINLAVLTETIKNLNGACLIVVTVVQ